MRNVGTYVQVNTASEPFKAFVPAPLPPDPPLNLTAVDHDLIERANRALGRLDGLTSLLPNISLFLYAYVRKEAVVSSRSSTRTDVASRALVGRQPRLSECSNS